MNTAENRAYWDSRAQLGAMAGTQDLILKQLEQHALLAVINDAPGATGLGATEILEVGCGTGETAYAVADAMSPCRLLAVDSSPEMILRAQAGWSHADVSFMVGDVSSPPAIPLGFDVVYSQRCLINLPTWDEQKQAIDAIADRLAPSGRFLMCEHSADHLDYINRARWVHGLSVIKAPWHNRYFLQAELNAITSLRFVKRIPFSATYYFLSRIVNAKLAEEAGQGPSYDAPVNQLALTLPYTCVDERFSQGCLWIWEKP